LATALVIRRVAGDDRALTVVERARLTAIVRQLDGAPPRAAAIHHLGCGGMALVGAGGWGTCLRCRAAIFA
jgi:hypothetical protein